MTLTSSDLTTLSERACSAARAAGAFIANARPRVIEQKPGATSAASLVVTDIDRESEYMILDALAPTISRHDVGVLSEETPDTKQRLTKQYFWCIDPLDGTLAFVEGTAGFAVSIALVSQAGTPVIGVVCDPTSGTVHHAIAGHGVFTDGVSRAQIRPESKTLSVFFDRSFQTAPMYQAVLDSLHAANGDVAINLGAGAVMNACRTLDNAPACYFKYPKQTRGGGSLWDFAATACLFAEAGAVATDIHGQPLDLNRADSTYMNHRGVLYATDPQIAQLVRKLYTDGKAPDLGG